ncbi:MAG: hypothetical protein OWQ48_03010 [Desulfurococcus sp.]|nr:hypothetical protein [Desulfurococcus sp.]
MRQRSLVFDGGVRIVDTPFVKIEQGSILAKTVYVYIGQLEESILNNTLPLPGRVVLGSTGVVKAIESIGVEGFVGSYLIVSPISRHNVLAYNADGLLTSYTAIKPEYILEEHLEANPFMAIKPLVAHGVELGSEAGGVVVVSGCGVTALSSALTVLREGLGEPILYCEGYSKPALQLGLNTVKHVSNLPERVDVLVLTEPGVSVNYKLLKLLHPRRIVVSPLSFTAWIPVDPGVEKIEVVYKDRVRVVKPQLTEVLVREIARNIRVVKIDDVEKAIGLLPPRGLGFIVSLE